MKILLGAGALLLTTTNMAAAQHDAADQFPPLVQAAVQSPIILPVFPETTISPEAERVHAAIPLDPVNVALVSVFEREIRPYRPASIRVIVMTGGRVSPDMRLVGASAVGGGQVSAVTNGSFTATVNDMEQRQLRLLLQFADDEGRKSSREVPLIVQPPPPPSSRVLAFSGAEIGWMSAVSGSTGMKLEAIGYYDSAQISEYSNADFPYKELQFFATDTRAPTGAERLAGRIAANKNTSWQAGLPGMGVKRGDIVRVVAVSHERRGARPPETLLVYRVR